MKPKHRIAVIGGGMGGLTAGVLLQRAGFSVNVYEQAKEIARIGAGINIYPNGMHVLRATGVVDQLMSIGRMPKTWYSRVWDPEACCTRSRRKSGTGATVSLTSFSIAATCSAHWPTIWSRAHFISTSG